MRRPSRNVFSPSNGVAQRELKAGVGVNKCRHTAASPIIATTLIIPVARTPVKFTSALCNKSVDTHHPAYILGVYRRNHSPSRADGQTFGIPHSTPSPNVYLVGENPTYSVALL